jgi:hypothetical protein
VETAREIEVELIKIRFNDQSKHQRRLNRQSKYRENFGFNQLTGLNQQVGNYPGITVEKKIGFANFQ